MLTLTPTLPLLTLLPQIITVKQRNSSLFDEHVHKTILTTRVTSAGNLLHTSLQDETGAVEGSHLDVKLIMSIRVSK